MKSKGKVIQCTPGGKSLHNVEGFSSNYLILTPTTEQGEGGVFVLSHTHTASGLSSRLLKRETVIKHKDTNEPTAAPACSLVLLLQHWGIFKGTKLWNACTCLPTGKNAASSVYL